MPDPANPGSLIASAGTVVDMAAPVWAALPPANPALPPVVVAVIPAPPPPPPRFGTAQSVRVYKVEQAGKVDLDDLVGDNHAVVPEAAAQLETNGSLLQADPPPGGAQCRRGKLANQGNAGNGRTAGGQRLRSIPCPCRRAAFAEKRRHGVAPSPGQGEGWGGGRKPLQRQRRTPIPTFPLPGGRGLPEATRRFCFS